MSDYQNRGSDRRSGDDRRKVDDPKVYALSGDRRRVEERRSGIDRRTGIDVSEATLADFEAASRSLHRAGLGQMLVDDGFDIGGGDVDLGPSDHDRIVALGEQLGEVRAEIARTQAMVNAAREEVRGMLVMLRST